MFKTRKTYRVLNLLLILVLVLSLQASVFAGDPDELSVVTSTLKLVSGAHPADFKLSEDGERLIPVIVKLEDASLAAYAGDVPGLAATSPTITGAKLDVQSSDSLAYLKYLDQKQKAFEEAALLTVPEAKIIHRYQVVFGGVSMIVPESELEALAKMDGVVAVYPDEVQRLNTERSPSFIGVPTVWKALGGQEVAGEGVVVGILDTGVWPEHPSFSDPDPLGNFYAPPPVIPGSNGFGPGGARDTCDFGNAAANPDDAPFTCNNKLIGAYDFLDTFRTVIGIVDGDFDSARDADGHGTHTGSTAAGNARVAASIFGVPRGTISGMAPRAHVIAYRVCGVTATSPYNACYSSDSMAAAQQAILDGADALNFSIGGGSNPYSDTVSQAFLDAYAAGVFVACSAGNAGPGADTVGHREPWTTTVGASTTDRHFLSTVTLNADNGDTLTVAGASVTDGIGTPTPVIFPPAGFEQCDADPTTPTQEDPFAPGTFNGEIVICDRGGFARVGKSFDVAEGGAGGMFLVNLVPQGLATDNHFIPSVHLENTEGDAIKAFMATHTGVTATFTPGVATTVQGDVMAAFSSRGGPNQTLGISKPDVTAPGVQILAGHSPIPAPISSGKPGEWFQSIQGTSMSSPHVAGVAALLKDLHPDWTPGQIKSALMTTAKTEGVTKEDGVTPADPFDDGSGRIDLTKAGDPGLTISESAAGFVALQDELWHANYPSVYFPVMQGKMTVQRTAHSELDTDSVWAVSASAPPDVKITVPQTINLPAGGDATFDITVDATDVPFGEVRHATVHLRLDPRRSAARLTQMAHIPVTLVREQRGLALGKTCCPGSLAIGDTTECTITVTNNSYDDAKVTLTDRMPHELMLDMGSVVGATQVRLNGVRWDGDLFAAGTPGVDVTPDALYGYLPLAGFGFPPVGCPSDCDDGGWIISGMDIDYLGQHYTSGIWSVNGTLELGTASGVSSSYLNQDLPDPAIPNNVLAPWWTDLNLSDAGNWYLGALTDGVHVWDIFEWEDVPRYGDLASTFSFQIWLERGSGNIHFAYGSYAGDTTDGSTGAEDADGLFGDSYYFDGAGTLPWGGPDLGVLSVAGIPGETHTLTFEAEATGGRWRRIGPWTNCAKVMTNLFDDISTACFTGQITP
jgi:subtilisin family serine protease